MGLSDIERALSAALTGTLRAFPGLSKQRAAVFLREDLFAKLESHTQVEWKVPLTRSSTSSTLCGENVVWNQLFPSLTARLLLSCDTVFTDLEWLYEALKARGVACVRFDAEFGVLDTLPAEASYPVAEMSAEVSQAASVFTFASIVDSQYLPFFVSFYHSLREVTGNAVCFFVLALDEIAGKKLANLSLVGVEILSIGELWTHAEWKVVGSRAVADRAYSSKARLLREVLRRTRQPCFYADLDLFFFRSPAGLFRALENHSVLLFPQWTDDLYLAKDYGMFNAGLIGVCPGAETEAFLEWWTALCLKEYYVRAGRGYFVDQGFLDLAPLYFPELGIYRQGDENIACWNLSTFAVQVKCDEGNHEKLVLGDGREVGSFHFVGPDRLRLYEWKHLWDQIYGRFHGTSALFWNTSLQQQHYHLPTSRYVYLRERLPRWAWLRQHAAWFQKGIGRWVLAALATLHYPTRGFQELVRGAYERVRARAKAPYTFWIGLQKKLLSEQAGEA